MNHYAEAGPPALPLTRPTSARRGPSNPSGVPSPPGAGPRHPFARPGLSQSPTAAPKGRHVGEIERGWGVRTGLLWPWARGSMPRGAARCQPTGAGPQRLAPASAQPTARPLFNRRGRTMLSYRKSLASAGALAVYALLT